MRDHRPDGFEALLRLRAIALLGISGRSENLISRPLCYLVEHGYDGGVYPVNSDYEELVGTGVMRRCPTCRAPSTSSSCWLK